MQLQAGDYLSSAYIGELKSTRSPLAADKTGSLTSLLVARNGPKVVITPGFNFHEAGDEYAVGGDGSLAPANPNPYNNHNLLAEAVDDKTLKFGVEDSPPADYIFVGDEYAYVAHIAIVGKYHNSQSRLYEFRDDGWAIFPDRRFKYNICLDHVLLGYDCYQESGKMWAFRRTGRNMEIFATADTDEGFEQITSTKPTLVLQEQ